LPAAVFLSKDLLTLFNLLSPHQGPETAEQEWSPFFARLKRMDLQS